jgi:hypothetical protein
MTYYFFKKSNFCHRDFDYGMKKQNDAETLAEN